MQNQQHVLHLLDCKHASQSDCTLTTRTCPSSHASQHEEAGEMAHVPTRCKSNVTHVRTQQMALHYGKALTLGGQGALEDSLLSTLCTRREKAVLHSCCLSVAGSASPVMQCCCCGWCRNPCRCAASQTLRAVPQPCRRAASQTRCFALAARNRTIIPLIDRTLKDMAPCSTHTCSAQDGRCLCARMQAHSAPVV